MRWFVPSEMGVDIGVTGIGSALGARRVDNAAVVAAGYPGGVAEIERLTGIRSRRRLADDETLTDLAVRACRQAGADGPLDALVVSCVAPPRRIPALGCEVLGALGLEDVPAQTINASCSGFMFALDLAARTVATGAQAALICAAEARSPIVDPTDRATGALFGDGAGALRLEAGAPGLLAVGITSRRGPDAVELADGPLVMRDGAQVYFAAVEGMKTASEDLLARVGMTWDDVGLVIPHQANGRILRRFQWLAGLDDARVFSNLAEIGNLSSASIPVALVDAARAGRLPTDRPVLCVAVGAGYSAGAALLRVNADTIQRIQSQETP